MSRHRAGDSPAPQLDLSSLKKHSPSDYITRFIFGAGIAAAAGIVSSVYGARIGGILLAFPAVLPASLTLIERKYGKREAAIDARGAVLGSFALLGFAVVAAWALPRFAAGIGLALASATWVVLAIGLYVLIVWLPRRRKRPVKIARPTST